MTVEMNRDLAPITRKLGEIKYLSAKIKQSPTDGSGRFVAVVSTFGPPPDTQNDIVSPGAFRASIAEASVKYPGRAVADLLDAPLRRPRERDRRGGRRSRNQRRARDRGTAGPRQRAGDERVRGSARQCIREWSIAYGINKAREDTWNGEHVRYLDELELLEISAVYSGANRFTRTIEVRSRQTAATVDVLPEHDEIALINARLDQLASNERPRSPELARQVDDLILATRLELAQEALDRAEAAAWERRMLINVVLDPVPVRVDARMRAVTS
jgi:hypothetical protein